MRGGHVGWTRWLGGGFIRIRRKASAGEIAEWRVVLDVVCFFVRLRQGPLQRCWNAPVPNERKGHSIQMGPIVDLVPIITLANIHFLEENMPESASGGMTPLIIAPLRMDHRQPRGHDKWRPSRRSPSRECAERASTPGAAHK